MRLQCQNMMYATIGHVMKVLTGSQLGEYLTEKLWHPLGMKESFLHLEDARKYIQQHSSASPHDNREDHLSSPLNLATPHLWLPNSTRGRTSCINTDSKKVPRQATFPRILYGLIPHLRNRVHHFQRPRLRPVTSPSAQKVRPNLASRA
jgi:CubicO group peptidase (beta-lactamase class C family)